MVYFVCSCQFQCKLFVDGTFEDRQALVEKVDRGWPLIVGEWAVRFTLDSRAADWQSAIHQTRLSDKAVCATSEEKRIGLIDLSHDEAIKLPTEIYLKLMTRECKKNSA